MRHVAVLAAALMVGGAAPPPPIANYWMDVATQSGMGAGLMGGGQPNMQQIMQMMQGGSQVGHSLNLYLASRQKPTSPAQAQHLIPPGLLMGLSLPLIAPAVARPTPPSSGLPQDFQRPKGKMMIYWGCGEHAGAGQPTVIDFAKVAAGQMPPGFAAMASAMQAAQPPRHGQSAGFGEWPNRQDSRPVPAGASLVGDHKVSSNYAPAMAFSMNAGHDFMPGLGLREAGALPSGAVRLSWTPAPRATGYALSMFGASQGGDVLVWTSANKPTAFPNMDYLSPSQVKQLVASGAALAPARNECTIPAEVVKASPSGMVMLIGYGPEAHFSDKPKDPTWTVRARYKSTASLMLGMGDMFGEAETEQPREQGQQPKKRRRGFGLGDLLQGAVSDQ